MSPGSDHSRAPRFAGGLTARLGSARVARGSALALPAALLVVGLTGGFLQLLAALVLLGSAGGGPAVR